MGEEEPGKPKTNQLIPLEEERPSRPISPNGARVARIPETEAEPSRQTIAVRLESAVKDPPPAAHQRPETIDDTMERAEIGDPPRQDQKG